MREWRTSLVALLVALMLVLWFAALALPALRYNGLPNLTQRQTWSLKSAAWKHCGLIAPFHSLSLRPDGDGGSFDCYAPFGVANGGFHYRSGFVIYGGEVFDRRADGAWIALFVGEALLALLLRHILNSPAVPS